MPREAIHWTVLKRTLAGLGSSPVANLFSGQDSKSKRCLAAAYLGAMAHDAPYYYKFGGADFESVAELLHGSGGSDTFKPLAQVASEILTRPADQRPVLWSFLLGMVSHYGVDTVFHPMIYYFTGDYYHPDHDERLAARGRHRLLETYLDAWATPKIGTNPTPTLRGALTATGTDLDLICQTLGQVLRDEPKRDCTAAWRSALKYLSDLQAIFHSDIAGRLFRASDKLSGGKLSPIEALFIYRRREPQPVFNAALKYVNPATGDACECSVDDLLNEATEKCRNLFLKFEPLIAGTTTDVEAELGGVIGDSLNFGIPNASYPDAKYFSSEGLPLEGLDLKK